MRRAIAVLIVLTLCVACEHGEPAFPKTRRGWGVVVIVVGGAWIVGGVAIAADDGESRRARIGGSLAAAGVGAGLIWLGWLLGGFHLGSAPPPSSPPAPG